MPYPAFEDVILKNCLLQLSYSSWGATTCMGHKPLKSPRKALGLIHPIISPDTDMPYPYITICRQHIVRINNGGIVVLHCNAMLVMS